MRAVDDELQSLLLAGGFRVLGFWCLQRMNDERTGSPSRNISHGGPKHTTWKLLRAMSRGDRKLTATMSEVVT